MLDSLFTSHVMWVNYHLFLFSESWFLHLYDRMQYPVYWISILFWSVSIPLPPSFKPFQLRRLSQVCSITAALGVCSVCLSISEWYYLFIIPTGAVKTMPWAQSGCSINICCINEWVNEWINERPDTSIPYDFFLAVKQEACLSWHMVGR